MNKQELIDAVATDVGISKSEAGKTAHAVLDLIVDAVSRGEVVQLVGFGAVSKGQRGAAGHPMVPRGGVAFRYGRQAVSERRLGGKRKRRDICALPHRIGRAELDRAVAVCHRPALRRHDRRLPGLLRCPGRRASPDACTSVIPSDTEFFWSD
ncbi:HU family DNA-binding protein [Burkholderia pyrrocinia]|nr:HU family DNA-binding protein [Burkholderia pyrrocinia]